MARRYDPRPIEYRTVCAIARVALLQAPHMTDAEWKAATLDACAKQGWDNPESDMLARAMGAVERALEQTVGRRHVAELDPPAAEVKPDRCWTPADLKALADTVKAIQARSAGATPTNVLTIPRERWEISEPAALDEFYRQAQTDRMAALKRFAEIAIARPADWDVGAVRAQATAHGRLRGGNGECFACRHAADGLVSHHVIQIQFGGSNYIRNRVDLCEECHAAIHPWLPPAARRSKSGWFQVGVLTPAIARMVARAVGRRDGTHDAE
jgi:hypothetical protein